MSGEGRSRNSLGENAASNDTFGKTPSPRVFGNPDTGFPFGNNTQIHENPSTSVHKYQRNLPKQSKGYKRSYKSMSNPVPIGPAVKKIRIKKRELALINRRSSIRLKGQASPLYFPPLRFRYKRANQTKEFMEISASESLVVKKKRGRPKRHGVKKEFFQKNDENLESKVNEFEVKKIPRKKRTKKKDVKPLNVEIQPETGPNESKSLVQKPQDLMKNNNKETSSTVLKPKRIWNIKRHHLPSFTIVNNPLLKPSNGKDIKSLAGLRHNQSHASSGSTLYACRICGKRFARKLSVRGHMKSHSAMFQDKHKEKQKTRPNLESQEKCTNTSKELTISKQPLQQPISKTAFICDVCGRIFHHKMGIRGHKKSHSSLLLSKRREAILKDTKFRKEISERQQNGISLGKPLNTRSRAGNFDDIIFSEENEQTEYPMWKKEVRIGEDFQVIDLPTAGISVNTQLHEDLLWSAEYTVPQVDEYLKLSDSPLTKFGGRNLEYALHVLFRCQGNIWDALMILIEGKNIVPQDDPVYFYNFTGLAFWSTEERNGFRIGWMKHGKDFSQIQKHIASKSLNQVIEFYYRWTIECPDEYKKYTRTVSSRKYLQTVSCTSNDTSANDTPENEEIDKNSEKTEAPVENIENVESTLEVVIKPVKKSRLTLPPPMGTPTRPPKSLKELVSSYQNRKEIKTQTGGRRKRDVTAKVDVVKKERKIRFPHKRVWNKQLHTTRKVRQYSKRIAQKADEDSKVITLEGIPVLKPVPNSSHKRIINRIGSFPCKKCRRVFDRIKSRNAHMKCHSIRAGKLHIITTVQNVSPATNSD